MYFLEINRQYLSLSSLQIVFMLDILLMVMVCGRDNIVDDSDKNLKDEFWFVCSLFDITFYFKHQHQKNMVLNSIPPRELLVSAMPKADCSSCGAWVLKT